MEQAQLRKIRPHGDGRGGGLEARVPQGARQYFKQGGTSLDRLRKEEKKLKTIRPWGIAFIILSLAASPAWTGGCEKKREAKAGAAKEKNAPGEIIGPKVAGSFYPADPEALRSMIRGFYEKTPDLALGPNLMGVICPHAGYIYSGPVASYVFKNLPKNRYEKIVIIFPSHHVRFRGILALDVDAYRTPLGEVEVDRRAVKELIEKDPVIFYSAGYYNREHSMEVMLPFLQVSLGPGIKIVPLMMGDQSPRMARRLAGILDGQFKSRRMLFLASTDLSHYHAYEKANLMDSRALTYITNLDGEGLISSLRSGKSELCGYGPVLCIMRLAELRGGGKVRVLKHANSGDTQGGRDSVVGYASIALFSAKGKEKD